MSANRSRLLIFLLGTATALAAPTQLAHADAQQSQSFSVWAQMQACAKQAFQQFPDYTSEGNAKREAARQECLREHRLPVTDPVSPPPPR